VKRGWAKAPLRDVIEPRGVKIIPSSRPDLRFIGMEHVEAQTMRILGSVPATEMKSSGAYFLANDVLYGRLRPYLNKIAKPDFEGIASAEFIVLPDTEHLRSGFLQYRLNARDFVNFASHINAGDRPRVDFDQIGEFEVELPPALDQTRTVAKIEELISDLDASVAALKRARANLKRYRAAVLKAAVEGKLTAEWRKSNSPSESADKLLERILIARRKKWEETQLAKYAAQGKEPPKGWKDKYSHPSTPETANLDALPMEWRWVGASQICKSIENGNTPPPHEMFPNAGEIPFIKVYNLTFDGTLDFGIKPTFIRRTIHEKLLKRSRVQPGDVLMNIVGPPLGKVSLVPDAFPEWNTNQAVVIFRASAAILNRFLVLCLLAEDVLHWITSQAKATAGQFNISVAMSRNLPLPLCSLEEQREIVTIAEQHLSLIAESERLIKINLAKAGRLREAILKRAFEGNLVPQDPNDEPASVLLERIRAARVSNVPAGKGARVRKGKRRNDERATESGDTLTSVKKKPARRDVFTELMEGFEALKRQRNG
jgi:type I restriction enzyme, S subunit